MEMLEAALHYIKMGWAVVPLYTVENGKCTCGRPDCQSPGKHPMTLHGYKDASLDEATVRRWFTNSQCNIGIRTGSTSGLLVIDEDPRNESDKTMARLVGKLGPLPKTLHVISGGNGKHRYFRQTAPHAARIKGKLGEGIDIQYEGKLIVAPPSLHWSGRRYSFEGSLPDESSLAELPDSWIRELVCQKENRTLEELVRRDHIGEESRCGPKEGERNHTIFRLACSLRAKEVPFEVARERIILEAAHCQPPLTDAEALKCLESAYRYPDGNSMVAKAEQKLAELLSESSAESHEAYEPSILDALGALKAFSFGKYVRYRDLLVKRLGCKRSELDSATKKQLELATWMPAPQSPSNVALDKHGKPLKTQANLIRMIQSLENLGKHLAFNRFENKIVKQGPIEWHSEVMADHHILQGCELRESDFTRIRTEVDRTYSCDFSLDLIHSAIGVIAEKQSFHPVADYLQNLKWDGTRRICHFSSLYLGNDDSSYTALAARILFVSAVARVLCPGTKVDDMIILEGDQGSEKSTLVSILAKGWFADTPIDLSAHNSDKYMMIQGIWIYEIAELSLFRGADWRMIKAFLSSRSDSFRPPYGRAKVTLPRQCIFVGTTNQSNYLGDATGNRRFYPLRVVCANIAQLELDVDQLWAEAVFLYLSGEKHWAHTSNEVRLALEEQERRREPDPWHGLVSRYVTNRPHSSVTSVEVAAAVREVPLGQVTRGDSMRVADILRSLGYRHARESTNGCRQRVFVRSEEARERSMERSVAQPGQPNSQDFSDPLPTGANAVLSSTRAQGGRNG